MCIEMVDWLCFTSHRQRDHLETAHPFTVPCEEREARFLHRSHRELNPVPSCGSPFLYRCATPALCILMATQKKYMFTDHTKHRQINYIPTHPTAWILGRNVARTGRQSTKNVDDIMASAHRMTRKNVLSQKRCP